LQAHEFFLFAGLMFLNMVILMWLATRYEYVDYTDVANLPTFSRENSVEEDKNSTK